MSLCQAAFSSKDVDYTPVRMKVPPDGFGDCRASGSLRPGRDDKVTASLDIARDGSVEKSSLPEDAPAWMTELSSCVLRRITFVPGTRNGKDAKRTASLPIEFAKRDGAESNAVKVAKVGPLLTPPLLLPGHGAIVSRCLPSGKWPDSFSRFVLAMTVMPDGQATNVEIPVGSEPWIEKAAQCMASRLKFAPGTRDGVPVQAQARLPIAMYGEFSEDWTGPVAAPKVQSSAEEFEALLRACYPPDFVAMQSIYYRFDVHRDGSVSNVKLVKGSGIDRLDQAGACIVSNLRFTPLMNNKRPVKSTVTWELPIRPPRSR
jgi:TonB family protein